MEYNFNGKKYFFPEYEPTDAELLSIQNWQSYGLTETQDDFISLLINLSVYDETLEDLHKGNADCGFVLCDDESEVVQAVLEHSSVYTGVEQFINSGHGSDDSDDIIYYYKGKIYRRIYC